MDLSTQPTEPATERRTVIERFAFALLALFVFIMPWENVLTLPGFGTIGRATGLAAVLLGAYSTLRDHRLRLRILPLFLVVGVLFVGLALVSFFWSVEPKVTLRSTFTYAQLLAMVWLVWQLCRSPQQRTSLVQSYVLGSWVAVLLIVPGFLTGNALGQGFRYTVQGFNQNDIATLIAVGMPMAWWLATKRRGLLFWLNLLYLPLGLLAVVAAASRGGLLVSLVAFTLVPLTYGRLGLWRRLGVFLLLGAVVYAVFTVTPTFYENTLQKQVDRLSTTTDELTSGDVSGRLPIWLAGLQVLGEHPLVGVGAGGFRYAVAPYLGAVKAPHNSFLSVAVDTGLIGLVLFLAMFAVALWPVLSMPASSSKAFLIILLLTLVVGMMPLNWEDNKIVWFVLALLLSERAYVLRTPGMPPEPLAAPPYAPRARG